MKNIDRLIKISEALELEAIDIAEMFELSEVDIDEEAVEELLSGTNEEAFCFEDLEAFLNGLIVFNRGPSPLKKGQTERVKMTIEDPRSANNVVLKKLKVAFSLNSEEMLELFKSVGVDISKDKLSCLFRKEGHKSYKYCRDVYVNGFVKAIGLRSMM